MGLNGIKLVSGGQTGADRAALDFAIASGIPHGGWCPKGRRAEDGTIDLCYQLKETPSGGYVQRTEWNVRDSDGTVVFSIAPVLTGGSKKTVLLAHKHHRPVLHISRQGGPASPEQALRRFVQEHGIKVLNVAGPRASKEPDVYGFVKEVLAKALLPVRQAAATCVAVPLGQTTFRRDLRVIPPLQSPDTLHLKAAQGWLELGNYIEANEELEKITPRLRVHPAVLEVRWEIYAKAKKWDACLDIASALVRLVPNHPLGWVHRSFCLHELERTAEARDNLLRVVDKFPEHAIMLYNLACYDCQLGKLEQAKHWLAKAFNLGDAKKMKLAALDDPDLEPLWDSLRRA